MQHLMLALAILLLTGTASKQYMETEYEKNTVLMKMQKMQEQDADFFLYGAGIDLNDL